MVAVQGEAENRHEKTVQKWCRNGAVLWPMRFLVSLVYMRSSGLRVDEWEAQHGLSMYIGNPGRRFSRPGGEIFAKISLDGVTFPAWGEAGRVPQHRTSSSQRPTSNPEDGRTPGAGVGGAGSGYSASIKVVAADVSRRL